MLHECVVYNASASLGDDEAQRAVAAVQRQLAGDFAPVWGTSLVLHYTRTAPQDHELAIILSDEDEDSYLGAHWLEGAPRGVVLLGACRKHGTEWSRTLSHEACELAGDPPASLCAEMADGSLWAWESSDPTQGDTYEIDGVSVEDFVYPWRWFHGAGSGKFDHMNLIRAPRELRPGGYQLVRRPGEPWSQLHGERAPEHRRRVTAWSRRGQRVKRAGGLLV